MTLRGENIMRTISLKARLLIAILTIIVLANVILVTFMYSSSKNELINSVTESNTNIAKTTAKQIHNINDREYKMLNALASLPSIKDSSIDLKAKWDDINGIKAEDSSYIGMAIYDENGIGWTTTGKYQDLHTREYLAIALQGKESILDPAWSPVNGQISTFYAVPFYGYNKKQAGVVVAVLDSFNLCETVSKVVIGKESHPYVINKTTGKYVAHENLDYLKEQKSLYEEIPSGMEDFIEQIKIQESGSFFYTDPTTEIEYNVSFETVGGNCDWVVICSAPSHDFLGGLDRLLSISITIAIIGTILMGVFVTILIMAGFKPIKSLRVSIKDIASGEGDLTKRIPLKSNDEIGEVVSSFNEFTEKLHSIVSDVKFAKNDLVNAGGTLQTSIENTSTSIDEIVVNIGDINKVVSNQTNYVQKTFDSVNEISENLENLNQLVLAQANGTENASSAIEQMVSNINSVNSSVEKMASQSSNSLENAKNGFYQQQDVSEKIEQIANQSSSLQDANAVIAAIAEQTNLLAMNAAIEAAHAGDAGKGFSVVADEIRKLSETSSEQSRTIGIHLNEIQGAIQNVVKASDSSSESFNSVVQDIEKTNQLIQEIKQAMQEQQLGSKQINESLVVMKESSSDVKAESSKITTQNKNILEEVKSLKEANTMINQKVSQMESEVDSISDSRKALVEISEVMSDSIKHIENRIDDFKV